MSFPIAAIRALRLSSCSVSGVRARRAAAGRPPPSRTASTSRLTFRKALRPDDPELGQVGARGVHQPGPLADGESPRAVRRDRRLPLGLDRDEAHRRAGGRPADRLGVGGVVLVPPDVGLDVARRHQPHRAAERRQLARPVVGRAGRLDADRAGRQAREGDRHVPAAEPAPRRGRPVRGDAVHLEDALGEVEADRDDLRRTGS
jgi:hypothetical protein